MKKLTWTIFLSAFLLASINIPVAGQLKIPKIFKPEQDQPVQVPTPQTPTGPRDNRQQQSSGDQPETISQTSSGNNIDDGFTWFEAVSFQKPVNGTRTDLGWALKSTIRLMGEYSRRSAFKITVSRAGKPVATTRCEGYSEASGYTGVNFLWTFDTIYDKHLAPVSVTEGFFYGQKWISAEGKAMAARVSTKGRLLPVPSNKAKQ